MSRSVDPEVIGDHIRRLRTDRQVTVRGFAAQTGFSPSFISQLENGQVTPSLGSLHKIAEALGVTLGERRRLDSTWTDAHIEALGSMAPSRTLEPVLAIFGTGGQSGKHPHSHSREEFAFVVKGQVTLTLADEETTLQPGDAVTLPAHAPRRWENRGGDVAEILMVSSRAAG
jgi:transcriptional regulator with XRE-family HTH domain